MCQFWVYSVIFLLLGFTRCFVIQSCCFVYHDLNPRCGYVSTANQRARSGAQQQRLFKGEKRQQGCALPGQMWRRDNRTSERCCVNSGAFQCAGSAFLAPQQFFSPTYPHDFPGRFLAFTVLEVGSEENTNAHHFGSCSVFLAPIKPSNHTMPYLKGWRLC